MPHFRIGKNIQKLHAPDCIFTSRNLYMRGENFQRLHALSNKRKCHRQKMSKVTSSNCHISKFHWHKFLKVTCFGTKNENTSGKILQRLHVLRLK